MKNSLHPPRFLAAALAMLLTVLLTSGGFLAAMSGTPTPVSTPTPPPAGTVSIKIIGAGGATVMMRTLALADLSFDLSPYVTAVTSVLTDPQPSALHALIALLKAEGRDPADKSVLDAKDSSFGVYVASILGSVSPFYWTFRVDGADSFVGVYEHKLAAGQALEFVLTEYVPVVTPVPGFVHPESGLPVQGIDINAVLTAISAGYAGTKNDWEILDMARFGQAGRVDRAGWLDAAYARLTARRVTTTDLELTAMVLTALGADARDVRIDGQRMDLMARIAAAPGMQTYEFIFGLAAFDSAAYPDAAGAANTRAAMVQGLLAARLPDGGWSWAPTEPISDTDTTAMAVSVLARYAAGDPAVASAIDAALTRLASWQAVDGTMGSSNATSMVIAGLTAMGIDGQTDGRFVNSGGNLVSGLFRYRTPENRFGYKTATFDSFATEQAFRALVSYRRFLSDHIPQSPYVFFASPAGLAAGTVLSTGADIADTGEHGTAATAIGLTLIASAFAVLVLHPGYCRRREGASRP